MNYSISGLEKVATPYFFFFFKEKVRFQDLKRQSWE